MTTSLTGFWRLETKLFEAKNTSTTTESHTHCSSLNKQRTTSHTHSSWLTKQRTTHVEGCHFRGGSRSPWSLWTCSLRSSQGPGASEFPKYFNLIMIRYIIIQIWAGGYCIDNVCYMYLTNKYFEPEMYLCQNIHKLHLCPNMINKVQLKSQWLVWNCLGKSGDLKYA